MPAKKIHLNIITQEKQVLEEDVDLVLAPSTQGQIGILPGHVGLLTKLDAGELFILKGPSLDVLAISGGFLDIHNDQLTIMADSAIRAQDINLAKAESAMKKAQATLKQKLSNKEFTLAASDLRRAVLELKVSKKRRHHPARQQN